jgi:hypothetical protein
MHTSIFVTFKICIFYNGISETTDLFQNNIHVEISLVFALQPSAKSFIFNGDSTKPLTYQCTRKSHMEELVCYNQNMGARMWAFTNV